MADPERKYLYFDIPKQERDSAISYLLESILRSRELLGLPSNQHEFDEDVNIYLAHLLFAASLPDYQDAVRRYVSLKVSDVAELVEKAEDRVIRYFIYKVNADHLLVHLGIFDDLESKPGHIGKSERQFSSMAQGYYEQASQYHRRIYRRKTAIGSVLEKLARSFEVYKQILRNVRKDFFQFTNEFQDKAFMKFCEDMKLYEGKCKYEELLDAFLDLYSVWIQSKDAHLHRQLQFYAGELKKINPNFSFSTEGE